MFFDLDMCYSRLRSTFFLPLQFLQRTFVFLSFFLFFCPALQSVFRFFRPAKVKLIFLLTKLFCSFFSFFFFFISPFFSAFLSPFLTPNFFFNLPFSCRKKWCKSNTPFSTFQTFYELFLSFFCLFFSYFPPSHSYWFYPRTDLP